MSEPKFQIDVDPNEDTEWNDILRDHNILPPKPISQSEIENEKIDNLIELEKQKDLERIILENPDDLDSEDEAFYKEYKKKRFEELKTLVGKMKFGSVYPISKNEYEEQVTNASKENIVLVHISSSEKTDSILLSSLLRELASKYPELKVCEILSHRCLENYPISNCPTLIIYENTQIKIQYITLAELGGSSCSLTILEKALIKLSILKPDDSRIFHEDDEFDLKFLPRRKKKNESFINNKSDSEY